jgi:hypothetical protein
MVPQGHHREAELLIEDPAALPAASLLAPYIEVRLRGWRSSTGVQLSEPYTDDEEAETTLLTWRSKVRARRGACLRHVQKAIDYSISRNFFSLSMCYG